MQERSMKGKCSRNECSLKRVQSIYARTFYLVTMRNRKTDMWLVWYTHSKPERGKLTNTHSMYLCACNIQTELF